LIKVIDTIYSNAALLRPMAVPTCKAGLWHWPAMATQAATHQFKSVLSKAKRIVVLTGAGVSAGGNSIIIPNIQVNWVRFASPSLMPVVRLLQLQNLESRHLEERVGYGASKQSSANTNSTNNVSSSITSMCCCCCCCCHEISFAAYGAATAWAAPLVAGADSL